MNFVWTIVESELRFDSDISIVDTHFLHWIFRSELRNLMWNYIWRCNKRQMVRCFCYVVSNCLKHLRLVAVQPRILLDCIQLLFQRYQITTIAHLIISFDKFIINLLILTCLLLGQAWNSRVPFFLRITLIIQRLLPRFYKSVSNSIGGAEARLVHFVEQVLPALIVGARELNLRKLFGIANYGVQAVTCVLRTLVRIELLL